MSFNRWSLLVAAFVFFTAAWFGVGYHAEDEQQHVIEFAEALRGNIPKVELAIEYHTGIRSMLQPLLCAGVFEVCAASGVVDPFMLTLILRLLTALLALWVIHGSVHVLSRSLPPDLARPFTLLSYSLWFIPVLNIRFTGEAWSGLFFMRGLILLLDEHRVNRFAFAGLWFGFTMLLRPAAAMLPLGVVLWLWFVQHAHKRDLARLLAAGCAAIVIGMVIDSAAYGRPVFTLWNYALAGFGGDEAWRFTPLPWYQHVVFIIKYAVVPIGGLILAAFVALTVLRPKHMIVWVLLPFILMHSMVPVKELRFLFPLAPLMPWLIISAWGALQQHWPAVMKRPLWLQLLFAIAAVNVIALLVGISTPAGNGRVKLAKAIQDNYDNAPVHIDQLGNWRQWIRPFYLAPNSTQAFVEKVTIDPQRHGPNHLVIAKRSLDMDRVSVLEPIAVATPAWTDRLLDWYMLEDDHDPLVLYRVTSQTSGH